MIGGGICNEVIDYIETWVPKNHEDEYGFQDELQTYLDKCLNESGNSNTHPAFGGGTGQQYPVRREYGKANADVAVGDDVGVELKHELDNGGMHQLSGQIRKYKKEFPCVVVVACGLADTGGWRELQNEYGGMDTLEMNMNQGEIHFVHKKKEHFGKDPSEVRDESDGFLNGGGIF
jgi:hypothetical protein